MTTQLASSQADRGPADIGRWLPASPDEAFSTHAIARAVSEFRRPAAVLFDSRLRRVGVDLDGRPVATPGLAGPGEYPCLGVLPPLYPEWLGDRGFCEAHGVRFPYVAGAMARGIASVRLVTAMARAGMLAFFGSAGLAPPRVAEALESIEAELAGQGVWGCNLIHSPQTPALEEALVELLLERRVRRVCASAFMNLTLPMVRYAVTGLRRTPAGEVTRVNHLFAKISRPEVAQRFMSPPPQDMLDELLRRGVVTSDEAAIARTLPLAEDYTVEADSGGHTDGRPLTALLPTIVRLRDDAVEVHGYRRALRIGAGGGLGTPGAVAAAFAMGAAYVLTGSVNQATCEAGVSEDAKTMLADAGVADVALAPAADMFELGAKVQVLARGTLFAARASRLQELHRRYDSVEALPAAERERLERQVFRRSLEEIWDETRRYFETAEPDELTRAEADPRHRLALIFRWYLAHTSRWPIDGETARRGDYQLWCGPAMGAFNAWVAGSFLEAPAQRGVVQIGLNLMEGAACITRAQQLRSHGVPVPAAAFRFTPRRLVE